MVKYTFYAIKCKDENITDCYISATTDMQLTVKKHTKRYKKGHQSRLYNFIREHGGLEAWLIQPLSTYETLYNNENITLIIKHYILSLNGTLNYEEITEP